MKVTIEDGTFWVLGSVYLLVVAYCIRHYIRVLILKNKMRKRNNGNTYSNSNSPHNNGRVQPKRNTWSAFFYPVLVIGCTGILNYYYYHHHYHHIVFII